MEQFTTAESIAEGRVYVPDQPPSQKLPPDEWLKKNLFNTWYNSALTVVLGAVFLVLVAVGIRFLFVTAQWEPVRRNLTNFMMGTYPREEQWRLITQVYLVAMTLGIGWGASEASADDRAEEAGLTYGRDRPLVVLKRFWAVILFVVVLLALAETLLPAVFVATAALLALASRSAARTLPRSLRGFTWFVAGLTAIVSFQVVTGTNGIAWWWMAALWGAAVVSLVGKLDVEDPRIIPVWQASAAAVTVAATWLVYTQLNFTGVSWDDWGGIQLTLVASVASIVLAFPLGLLLALGRRSTLPAIRMLSVAYIELFRGVPLITLLLGAAFFFGFFLDTTNPLSLFTRAVAAMTLFTAAYVAEIVRGGLQAVPRGQVEAGQSLGLTPPRIMGTIVLPQALRAVIPAMVGQFISLFKDTSLLTIIGITEFLNVREIVHAQPDFRSTGIAETLVFVAFGYWAIAYTMSRESQRLERKLGVGER